MCNLDFLDSRICFSQIWDSTFFSIDPVSAWRLRDDIPTLGLRVGRQNGKGPWVTWGASGALSINTA